MNHFFAQLNQDLKQSELALPRLIVDAQAFEQNLHYAEKKFQYVPHVQPRLVVKSLACLELLKQISQRLATQRFMVFHLPQLLPILETFSDADVLLGKPMPVSLLQHFYQENHHWQYAKIQWLVDTQQRLEQYLDVAKKFAIKLKISIEIDVGLHRGGVSSEQDLRSILAFIQTHAEYLEFAGLMGYDAHVTKLPSIIKKAEEAYAESQQIYQNYQLLIQRQFPQLWHDELCFNGGGSPTFAFHVEQSVCNDLAFGSMLLKPSDFDSESLHVLKSALWIATPVLKVLPYTQLPGLTLLDRLPHRTKALFVYGGYWMADYVHPQGIHPHALYGRSTNQEMVNVPKQTQIDVDDFVFLRPTQSEAIIPQFAKLWFYKNRQFEACETFRE
ncbi:alanine racemase [Acinetobacter sp. WCHAc060025]|uniref:alanine racemase n=1 Tax=Acinetobacter sp. WCHAc060025 TaxID=2518625 RepID=UPI001023583B|nr:alanine racemase [Acinetobacter sp. WCHAc060025]RZG77425.1 alanine racemase [Acinetobacter sp. WCHAc060025]